MEDGGRARFGEDGGRARFGEDGWRSQVLGGWMAAEPGSGRMDGGARLREDGWRSQAQGGVNSSHYLWPKFTWEDGGGARLREDGWMAEPGSGRSELLPLPVAEVHSNEEMLNTEHSS